MATATQCATSMNCGNRVLSGNHRDVETCLFEQERKDDILTGETAESASSALLSIVESRGLQSLKGKATISETLGQAAIEDFLEYKHVALNSGVVARVA